MEGLNRNVITNVIQCSSLFRKKVEAVKKIVSSMARSNISVTCYSEVLGVFSSKGFEGVVEDSRPEEACFAKLPNASNLSYTVPLAVIAGIHPNAFKNLGPSLVSSFFDWLCYESAFKSAFLGYETHSDSGAVVVRGDRDARLVVGALIAARAAHEFPCIVKRWEGLIALGFKKDAAHLLAHFLETRGGLLVKGTTYTTHCVYNVNQMTASSFKAFLKEEIGVKDHKDYWEKGAQYRGIDGLWGISKREETLLPCKLNEWALANIRGLEKDRWGSFNKKITLTPSQLCKAIGVREDLILGNPPVEKGKVRAVSARSLRERAWKEALAVSLENPPNRKAWLKDNPLSSFGIKEKEDAFFEALNEEPPF